MDNVDKNTSSSFDAPMWSTLIDEAATEQSHYENVIIYFRKIFLSIRCIIFRQMKRMITTRKVCCNVFRNCGTNFSIFHLELYMSETSKVSINI